VKELVQVHKDGVYLFVLLFALYFALKQAGVDVSTMLQKVQPTLSHIQCFIELCYYSFSFFLSLSPDDVSVKCSLGSIASSCSFLISTTHILFVLGNGLHG
jgi:hypothetical protein